MKRLRTKTKWLLAIIGLLFALLILKITLFLIAKPKITVDYMAKYNRISRPANCDPNDNAAQYYQKAFDAFVEMPEELIRYPKRYWPEDYNSAEKNLLKKWLISNTLAFEYFRRAINKSYYWIKRTTGETDDYLTKNYIGEIKNLNLSQLRKLTQAIGWDAKLKAANGEFQIAFKNIIECYKAGKHKCNPNLLRIEQYCGLNIKQNAIKNAFIILDKSKVNSTTLKFLQNGLQEEFYSDNYIPGCEAEKLYQLDKLQRMFIDNGKGTGRLWCRMGFSFVIPLCSEEGRVREHKMKMSCFTGPTKKQAAEQIEKTAALFNQVIIKTPWQIRHDEHNYIKEIDSIFNRHFSLKVLDIGIYPFNISDKFYEIKAQTEALIAVLAILRFEEDNNRLPTSLDELVSAFYLQSVPVDPYSDKPLVYKQDKDNFTLYSVGKNFVNDGGSNESQTNEELASRFQYGGPYGYPIDIIYWPVKYHEYPPKGFEKLKAEK